MVDFSHPQDAKGLSPLGLLREPLTVLELPRLAMAFSDLANQPQGRGQPVMVLPGFGSNDATTALLRRYLSFLGYETHGWGLGRNHGDLHNRLLSLYQKVDALAARHQSKVRLVGWSLGGFLARELAREYPQLIDRVITLGSPVTGGLKYTVAARYCQQQGIDLDALEALLELRNETKPLQVPITAIFSKLDPVVAWEACLNTRDRQAENIAVYTTHFGLIYSPETFALVAQRLADDTNAR